MKRLIDFPQFTVKEVCPRENKYFIFGSFDQTKIIKEERYWLVKNDECYISDLCELDRTKNIGAFVFSDKEEAEYLQPFKTYSCITSYWNWNFMETILNPETQWKSEVFQPKDAQIFYLPNGMRGWCEIGQKIDKDATFGEVIKNGWDHEHCELCNARIGRGGKSECYRNNWVWLCVDCFEKYALNHDLSFTDEG